MDPFIITKYNQVIEYEHLGKIDEAYQCIDWLKRYIYEEKVIGHFLEKKIQDVYHDIRKKKF